MNSAVLFQLACSAIYANAAILFAMLYLRRHRVAFEHLAFAGMMLGFSTYCFGEGMCHFESTALSSRGFLVQYLGCFLGLFFCASFVDTLIGRSAVWLVPAAGIVSLLGAGATLGGVLGVGYADRFVFYPLGFGIGMAAIAVLFAAMLSLILASRKDTQLRWLTVGAAPGGCMGIFEHSMRLMGYRVWSLTSVAGIIMLLAVSMLLFRRYVRTSKSLERRTEALRRSYRHLERTQHELVEKEQLAAIGELSAVIAHEVRNPLAIVKNALATLRRAHPESEDRLTLVAILDEETERLDRLVRDLLTYARPLEPARRIHRLSEIVHAAFHAIARAKGSSIERVDLVLNDADESEGNVDSDMLTQAFSNIIENASIAMNFLGALEVRIFREGSVLRLDFRDEGEGMDALVVAKACQPFFTMRSTGTGLGLSIVRRIVRAHGGDIAIESQRGIGTTVSLSLPDERAASVEVSS